MSESPEGSKRNIFYSLFLTSGNSASSFAIAFAKDSPLQEKINAALQQLKADGTLEKLNQKWLQK